MLTATGLAMAYGGQTLFTGADLQLHPGRRYGIVGANGSGKSTLLRILSGELTPSAGDVRWPRSTRLGVLDQDQFRYDAIPLVDVVMMGRREVWDALQEKEAVLARAAEHFDDARYAAAEDVILRLDGYGLEARAGEILEGLGIPTATHRQPLRSLSGGFKLRVLLAQVLASDPDLLFLDEPTNHLDILAIRWLEQFLLGFRGCAVVVSHDHRFLDAVCTDILDVDYARVTAWRGNYTAFVAARDTARDQAEREIAKREREIADHKAFIARFAAKATKARQANSRAKQLDRVVLEELPRSSRRHPRFAFTQRRTSGREVLRVRGLSKAYGDRVVLRDVSFDVERGDRLALLGANGIGKSTLLELCLGLREADAGTATWGHEVQAGWFPQDHAAALGSPEQTVLAAAWEALPEEGLGAVLGRLAAVLFTRTDADKKVGTLSGGERARLLFARLAARAPNVLVLDEPTNHLDLEGIEALSDALAAYDGTLIFVSHDRWFVERLASRVIALGDQGLQDFRGGYAEYAARAALDHLDADAVVSAAKGDRRRR